MERDENLPSGMAKRQKKNLASLHQIPIDVLVEIFLRLPAKSLARFVGVSTICASIIRGRHFIRSYSFRSSEPRFLLAATKEITSYNEEWYFFSKSTLVSTPLCPVPKRGMVEWAQRMSSRNEETKDLALVETPPDFVSSTVCHTNLRRYGKPCYAHGLMMVLYGDDQVVINPSTGKSITLPAVKTNGMVMRSFLGYDPNDAQHKVLCFTYGFCQHHVLTLGRGKNCSWRTVQCSFAPHFPGKDSVCVDGVLYYVASAASTKKNLFLVVGFDLRTETFEIVSKFNNGVGISRGTTLINYHGKAAFATRNYDNVFHLWVLEDTKTGRWSHDFISVPRVTGIYQFDFDILGASELGEIIFAPIESDKFYLYFLDRKSNQIRRAEQEGST